MTGRPFFKITYAFAFFAITAITALPPAFSQDATLEDQCTAPPLQTITTLQQKSFGMPPLWDASYENGHDESFYLADGFPLDDGTVLITGMTYKSMAAVDGSDNATFEISSAFSGIMPESVVIAQLNQRGRTVMEKHLPARPYEKIKAMKKSGIITSSLPAIRKVMVRPAVWGSGGWIKKEILSGRAALPTRNTAMKP